jgi:hypothetical protein
MAVLLRRAESIDRASTPPAACASSLPDGGIRAMLEPRFDEEDRAALRKAFSDCKKT